MKRNKKDFLLEFIEGLQANGRYWFSHKEVYESLKVTQQSLAKAINRLAKKGKIVRFYNDFQIIIPPENKKTGMLPPTWFIDPLMHYVERPYCVGLLSAATLYGAAHQKVQEFQVIVNKTMRSIVRGTLRIKFINKKYLNETLINKIKTPTGYINISTPEATALDLIQYMGICGSLANVATVLSELSEQLNAEKLLIAAVEGKYEFPTIQRLGYLLEYLGKDSLIAGLLNLIKNTRPKYVRLRSDLQSGIIEENEKWHIIKNDIIEVDI